MARTSTRERTDSEHRQASAPQEAPKDNLPAEQRRVHPLVAFQTYAQERMDQLGFALPPHISPDRFTRIALTALQRKPELLKCTRQSLWNACLLAAQDGLMPDGREGAIVPYGENENGQKKAEIATWMPMIEGLRKKARNSGQIRNWEVHVVRERDHFKFALGDDSFIEHEPYFGAEEPGDVIGAYSIATMIDGTKSRDVMTIRDIMKIRAKSKAKNGPWSDSTFFPEMCKKTVARRHYKQLPHSSDLDSLIARDDEAFGLDERSNEQIEQRQARRLTSVAASFDAFAAGSPEYDHTAETKDGDAKDADDGAADSGEPGELDDTLDDDLDTKPINEPEPPPRRTSSRRSAPDTEPEQRKTEPPPEPETDTTGDDDLGDERQPDPTDDPGIDQDAIRLAPGQEPENDAEFKVHVEQVCADAKSAADLKSWWLEGKGYELRQRLKVHRDVETLCRDIVRARAGVLAKARS